MHVLLNAIRFDGLMESPVVVMVGTPMPMLASHRRSLLESHLPLLTYGIYSKSFCECTLCA